MEKATKIILAIVLVLWVRPAPAMALELLFFDNLDKVGAKGVTPRGDVLFLSSSRERVDWTPRIVARLDIAPSGQNGLAFVDNVSVVDPSIWAAVDLPTGEVAVASPSNQYAAVPVQESGLLAGNDFVYAGERLDLVVIRGNRAWHARAHDGGDADHGPAQDGQVAIAYDALEKVYPSVSFAVFGSPQNGDLLIGIDADSMSYFILTVTSLGEGEK
jgi:hypothetical protein